MASASGEDEAIERKEDYEDGDENQVQVKQKFKEPPEELSCRGCFSWNVDRFLRLDLVYG